MSKIIALLTDFGLSDAYVGIMKGVIASICPTASQIDITHAIEPQNVRQAAYVLLTSYRYFPADTVFLVVVDPGVGTAREPIAVAADHGLFVAPDNGVLSYVLARQTVTGRVGLHNPAYRLPVVSRTFHGRDIFSPAAAHLAAGIELHHLGPALPDLQQLPDPRLDITPTTIHGEVLHIDRFGNVITSIGEILWEGDQLRLMPRFGANHPPTPVLRPERCLITAGSYTVQGITPTYGAVPPGTLTALVGSSGQLELGVNQGHAAHILKAALGDPITLSFEMD